jgi:RNA polymerase sigma-70 factor (ECF subfamily)
MDGAAARQSNPRTQPRGGTIPLEDKALAAAPDELTDNELLRLLQEGEDSVFRVLVKRYWGKAYTIAHGMVGNKEDAWDIAQDSFLRVYKASASFDLSRAFHTWLYRIVTNLCIDQLRRKSLARTVALDDIEPSLADRRPSLDALERRELRGRIDEAFEVIPPKYRAVLILRDVHGLACKEIGKIMRCTHSTVRWRLHRARKIFREHWERAASPARGGGA